MPELAGDAGNTGTEDERLDEAGAQLGQLIRTLLALVLPGTRHEKGGRCPLRRAGDAGPESTPGTAAEAAISR
jgi:hypothetical protein